MSACRAWWMEVIFADVPPRLDCVSVNSSLSYALACVVVPAVWGVLMYFVFGYWDARRRRAPKDGPPPIDYSI